MHANSCMMCVSKLSGLIACKTLPVCCRISMHIVQACFLEVKLLSVDLSTVV